MDADFKRYHFSATFHTDDEAVLHCLRALCQWAQRDESNPNIGWGGTGRTRWQSEGNKATVRFTSEAKRQKWIDKAKTLLPTQWNLIGTADNDPASRQRVPH
jgi:hypothetical protein